MAINVDRTLRRYEELKKKKSLWLPHWQLLGEYFMTRKSDFTVQRNEGDFLNRDLFDNTGSKARNVMAAALLGMLWPSGAKSFIITRPPNIPDTPEHKKYYDTIYQRLADMMDDPEAGLAIALDEFMQEDATFGTAAIGAFENEGETDILYKAWGLKNIAIAEGPNGKVNTVYFEMEYTVEQVIELYGAEKLSPKVQELYANKKYDDKVLILIAIEPRYGRNPNGRGNMDMPVSSCHLEVQTKHLIRESGFDEMSVFVSRFRKVIGEVYGRSCAMDALPDVLELNTIREAEIVATEKHLDPPLGVIDDGKLGTTTIDTSAGAINVFNMSGRAGSQQPIFPLYTMGDLKYLKERIEELKQSISDHFMIDRLLDLSNEKEMTLGEAQLRNKLRGMTLGSLFTRKITEVFTPLIKRSFNMGLKKGRFGVMPDSERAKKAVLFGEEILIIPPAIAKAIVAGQDVYNIEYLTPAQRMINAEQAEGIINSWKAINDIMATQPEAVDNLDEDISIRTLSPLLGAPRIILRDMQTVQKIRDSRAKAQAEAAQKQEAIATADAAAKVAKAVPAQPQPVGV